MPWIASRCCGAYSNRARRSPAYMMSQRNENLLQTFTSKLSNAGQQPAQVALGVGIAHARCAGTFSVTGFPAVARTVLTLATPI
jgi:hypothetical protein